MGGRSARIKTRPVRDGPLGKVWRGLGGRIKENDKKNHEKDNFAEKIVHTEQPRKNSCIDLPKYFTEILAVRNREQIGVKKLPYSKASVQRRCLLKTTSKFLI